ncbi:TULIP family P47-like protein [Pseudomonas sp. S 311-6]|uniref:TULIP family P47-like protein n=1 Tax=Pseudomonas TaxID=286 RepID=UPI001CE42204|nr:MULTISPECIES: TULIP family P47-like protein [Pseudomonas]MCO7639355.1 TULIP family P47-like protein [Pseudomonas sp. S 311-6]MCO7565059.1 TULIP family P47-like protein [Pseudomonas mosselii]MCO7593834.1 TULIP family P47-like protein [Pseudomonas guariconensis]MCO7616342.1 TULIP family P47-like protein [Pseudomonas guariconensis]MCO7631270.1 TULIP family P47-like protein [Pseudomonas guariconensis]
MATPTDNTSLAPVPVSEIATRPTADTYDWDTVVALHFDTTNTALTDNWGSVDSRAKTLTQAASDDPSYQIQASLDPWQLTIGGDGKNINMSVPIASGVYQAGANSYPLDGLGMSAIIQINMDWIPDPDQKSFVINSGVAAIVADLDNDIVDAALIADFAANGVTITSESKLSTVHQGAAWLIAAADNTFYYLFFSQDKDQNQFLSVYQYTKSFATQLRALSKEAGATPAVVVMNVLNPPNAGSIGNAVLPELLSEWFNSNISYFNFVFSVIDLTPQLDQSPSYTWIDPTATSYAVIDEQTMTSSVMGVLTMVQNNRPGANHQVSPNAIPTGSDANGANVGLLISGQNFMKNMMLGGAKILFDDASDEDFSIFNDGLSIQNVNALTYGYFKMEDDPDATTADNGYSAELDSGSLPQGLVDAFKHSDGEGGYYYNPDLRGDTVKVNVAGSQWFLSGNGSEYIVDLNDGQLEFYTATQVTIAAGQFEMNLEHSFLEIKFIDLTYSQSWQYDVHINYTEQVNLGLKTVTTSTGATKQIFNFTQSVRNMTVDVTKTQAEITFEIVMGAVTASLALVAVLGPIVDGLASAAEVTVESVEEGSAVINETTFVEELSGSDEAEEQNLANEKDALANGAEQTAGRMTRIKNAFNSTRWKVFGGITGAVAAASGIEIAVSAIMAAVYNNEWDNVPGFDEFANDAIEPYTFPGVTGYDLTSAWLADSLQIGLKTK